MQLNRLNLPFPLQYRLTLFSCVFQFSLFYSHSSSPFNVLFAILVILQQTAEALKDAFRCTQQPSSNTVLNHFTSSVITGISCFAQTTKHLLPTLPSNTHGPGITPCIFFHHHQTFIGSGIQRVGFMRSPHVHIQKLLFTHAPTKTLSPWTVSTCSNTSVLSFGAVSIGCHLLAASSGFTTCLQMAMAWRLNAL